MKFTVVLPFVIAIALALPAQAQQATPRMYKCVDATGKVYYSDKLNPDCGQGSELNRQGVAMPKKKVAGPAPHSKADVEVDSKDSQHQERRDRALIATYTTEEEIDAARDRSLAIPAQATKSVESKLNKINEQLTELRKQADALTAQKKPVPPRLLDDINAHQKDLARIEADLAQRKAQSDSISAKFEADKLRFREL
ncbi:MAG: DUF4124 domain-containing protein, partial [Betaproteobacteria bacterium]